MRHLRLEPVDGLVAYELRLAQAQLGRRVSNTDGVFLDFKDVAQVALPCVVVVVACIVSLG